MHTDKKRRPLSVNATIIIKYSLKSIKKIKVFIAALLGEPSKKIAAIF